MPEEGTMGPKRCISYEVVCTQRLIWLFVCEYPRMTYTVIILDIHAFL